MRVLLINQAYYPDESATAQYAVDLARGLIADGHAVTVLAANRGYLHPTDRFQRKETIDGVDIVRVGSPALPWRFKLLRMADALFLNLSMVLRFHRLGSFDCTVCMTSPPLLGTFLGLYTPKTKGRLVHWAMDINPDQAIRAGWIRPGSTLASFLMSLQKRFYSRCDAIIALDRFMKKVLEEKGVASEKIHVIPLWWSDEYRSVDVPAVAAFRRQYDLEDATVIMYAGNHSLCHPLDAMLQAAFLCRDRPDIRFVFMGGGSRSVEVTTFADLHGLANIIQIPYQPRSAVPAALSAADLQVVSCGLPYTGVVHPSKVYPFLVLGLPFILLGDRASSVGEIVDAGAFGLVVQPDDGSTFYSHIEAVLAMPEEEIAARTERSRELARQYGKERLVPGLIQLLSE